MRKILATIVPFACMFAIATGSVVIACASAPSTPRDRDARVSINAGPEADGKIRTAWVLDGIQSIVIVDLRDRTRKIELSRGDWRYDPETTELEILREVPFADYAARVEGRRSAPHAFELNGIKDESSLMVILDGRLAIAGYDYAFDARTSRLTLRDDVELRETDWCVSYLTAEGGFMIGEWKPGSADAMSYIEAEHRRRYLESWYDRQDAFWFLDETRREEWALDPGKEPPLARRRASAGELAEMKAESASVLKTRTRTSDAALSRELGLNAKVPKAISPGHANGDYPIAWKTIEETSEAGNLTRRLRVAYARDRGTPDDLIEFTISDADIGAEGERSQWLADERVLDLGCPVRVARFWGTKTRDIDERPSVALLSSWEWLEGNARFGVTRDARDDGETEALIRAFIAARMKRKR